MVTLNHRQHLRRIDDLRALIMFCARFKLDLPQSAISRLAELGIDHGHFSRVIGLLNELDRVEAPHLRLLPEDRRLSGRRLTDFERPIAPA